MTYLRFKGASAITKYVMGSSNNSETPSKVLVRRGSRMAERSITWGLELAVPIGIVGLLLMNLRKRKQINNNQLALVIKTPTYIAAFGTCLGVGIYFTGKIIEHFR